MGVKLGFQWDFFTTMEVIELGYLFLYEKINLRMLCGMFSFTLS
ncbi:uncharacterized protein METZ01_LOCUS262000 [marine metagenome]|uniref:Uncharacterized protein n=1 Tax=marine metagenome TaxID=408172 RepID=A0A382JB86_9ZZZZ